MELNYPNVQTLLMALAIALIYLIYKLGEWNYNEFARRKMPYLKPTLMETISQQCIASNRCLDQPIEFYNRFKGNRAVGFFHYTMRCVYVLDPAVLKLIITKNWNHFQFHNQYYVAGDAKLFSKTVIASQGDRWRQMRSILTPAFTPSKMKNVMFDVVLKKCQSLANHIQEKCRAVSNSTLSIEAKDLFLPFSVDTMAEVGFGIQENSLKEGGSEIFHAVEQGDKLTGYVGYKYYLANVLPYCSRLIGIDMSPPNGSAGINAMVKKSKELIGNDNTQRGRAIHYLVDAQRKEIQNAVAGVKGREIDDSDILANVFNFIGASFDSTGSSHSHLAYLLAMNPEIQARARQEVEQVLEQDGGRITYEGLQRMKYLEQTIQEGLRYIPPVAVTERTCSIDYVVPATESSPPITFKRGDYVLIPTLGLQRDPDLFPEPERFDPDRWSDENKHNIVPYTFLAFGAGPRECIATRYVYMEAKVLFATLLTRFTFVKTAKTPDNVKVTMSPLSLVTNRDFWIGIKLKSEQTV